MERDAQPEDEFVEAIYYAPVYDAQDDYSLGAIGQKFRHSENKSKFKIIEIYKYIMGLKIRVTKIEK